MRSAALSLVVPALLAAVPASGAEVLESVFQTTVQYAGREHVINGTTVPLLPDNACYSWYIRVEGTAPTSAIETLTLPVPLVDWGAVKTDPNDGIEISADDKVAVRTFTPELDGDGWFSHSWCVAAGDPLGLHTIDVSIDGQPVAVYDFAVVLPDEFDWPGIAQPDPRGRSVNDSW